MVTPGHVCDGHVINTQAHAHTHTPACSNVRIIVVTCGKNPFINENEFFRAIAYIHRHVITHKHMHMPACVPVRNMHSCTTRMLLEERNSSLHGCSGQCECVLYYLHYCLEAAFVSSISVRCSVVLHM